MALLPSIFHMERNAFVYAPGARVIIGHDVNDGNFAITAEDASRKPDPVMFDALGLQTP